MPLKEEEYRQIKSEAESSARPVYFFHDDPDGVCSFLQLYDVIKQGKGIIVKATPRITESFLPAVESYMPDKIFIVDIAMLDQDFADSAKAPIVWIDHHYPQQIHNAKYFNPMKSSKTNEPVSYLCYKAIKRKLWLAVLGAVSDMFWPEDLLEEFEKSYPGLLGNGIKNPRKAIYETKLGELSRIFSFVLKGTSSEAMKYVKALTRIKEPDEILEQKTAAGKFIFKRYMQINSEYKGLIKEALEQNGRDIIIFSYGNEKMSFTSDLANELSYVHPEKAILVAREKDNEMKCSIRSEKHNLPKAIENALTGIEGFGGGHKHAAGCVVPKESFSLFCEQLKSHLINES